MVASASSLAAAWVSLFAALASPAAAQPNLVYLAAPTTELVQDSIARFTLAGRAPGFKFGDSCALYRSPAPVGDKLAGHSFVLAAAAKLAGDSSSMSFAFTPKDKDSATGGATLALGVHFLVAACRDGKDVTPEFPLRVVTTQAAAFLSPKALETSSSPTISWTPVPGVPAYHVLLSDQAIKIDPDKGSVDGASVIWQAITAKTSIAYGTADPSGNFAAIPAPPLSPGVSYNLVLLNNYDGRSTLATSAKAQSLKLFSIQGGPTLAKPKNTAPAQGASLTAAANASITLKWTASKSPDGKSANTYKAFVYSREKQNSADVLVPIWQSEVTDTFAVLDAKRTLLSKTYVWKVFAVSDAGAGVVGDTTSFTYANPSQTLHLTTKTLGAGGDTVALGEVKVTVTPLDGGADPLPLFTLEDGTASKELAAGGYVLDLSKAGYASQRRSVTLDPASPLSVIQFMPPSPSGVTGRAVDAGGIGLDNVTVTGAAGGKASAAVTDAQGYFLLGASQGSLGLSFAKADYLPRDTAVTLKAGQTLDLGAVKLARAGGALGGRVANDKGAPLSGCRIDVKDASGTILRTLYTDDKGGYSAYLAPGSYVIGASRLGFASAEKPVQLTEAAQLDFTLASGASVLKGRVTIAARVTAGTTQVSPLEGAQLELRDASGLARTTQSDLRGDYSFSLDTGSFRLKVTAPGKASPDSFVVIVTTPKSTLTRDAQVDGLASVQGTLKLTPDSAVNPASATVSLLRSPSLSVYAAATPSKNGGTLAWSFDGVPDGSYLLTCGLPGYGPVSEPAVTVAGGVWVTGVEIPLKLADKTLTFKMTKKTDTVSGTIRILTPEAREVESGKAITKAASGTYVFDAVPDSLDLLPLSRATFFLPAVGASDTTVTLPMAFSHVPRPLTLTKGAADLILKSPARIDSAFVVSGYGAPTDTFRLPSALAATAGDSVAFHFSPGARGGTLTYYFVVYSGAYRYSNEAPDRRYKAEVAPSRELASISLSLGDSLRLPANSRCEIFVHAFDAGGNRLDTLVDLRGKVTLRFPEGLPARLEGKASRKLVLTTGGAQAAAKRGAAKSGAAKSGGAPKSAEGTAAWDSVTVTVTLDSIGKSLRLPARVLPARINKLVMTSTLGGAPEINAPAPFGLFISGFDTTATPPVPLVASPELALDPPEAGVVAEQRVTLSPRFIGPVRVTARHTNSDGSFAATELGAERDSLLRGINVGQTLAFGDSARLFTHDPQCEIAAPDSLLAAPGQAVLRLHRKALAKTFTSGITEVVAGRVYEISDPSGAAFAKPLRLRLGIPSAYHGRESALKRFDADRLDWKDLGDSAAADTNFFGGPALSDTVRLLDGNYYALLSKSKALSAGALDIVPNPFSPLVLASRDGNTEYGTRIRLRPESDRSADVTVSIRVYNLDGELVRLLVDHKTIPKAPADFYWDGKTDTGRWARNGRYLVKVTLSATGSREMQQVLKPVVVFQ